MEIDIASLNFDLTPAIAEYADRRVLAACITAAGMIEGAIVRLWDVNPRRAGLSKGCKIRAWLPRRLTLVVEAIDVDLHNAIDIAAARLRRALRRYTHEHKSPHGDHASSAGNSGIQYTFLMTERHRDQTFPSPDRN